MRAVVAIIGAECSGKSVLAEALGKALPATVVPEYLRHFVDRHGRPPTRDEQRQIMAAQIQAESAVRTGWVVSDSGALMTAVYSLLYYSDDSLVDPALAHHRTAYRLTVWCDIDLPWTADQGQRDGPQFRERGHEIIRSLLDPGILPVLRVAGTADERVAAVLGALRATNG